jgi:hypothetical protein
VALPQLLVHFGDRHAKQIGDNAKIVSRFVGVQNVVAGRNRAHRISVRPGAQPVWAR